MSDCLARATALIEVLTARAAPSNSPPILEAIVACCGDLLTAGEPATTLDLIERARGSLPGTD